MPFVKRLVEPTELSKASIPRGVNNELEFVTNGTLANIILQLSSLSSHAGDIFGELYNESEKILARTGSLQGRVERLHRKVTQLDSNVEEGLLPTLG